MNRYSKIIYNDWTKENGRFIGSDIVEFMVDRKTHIHNNLADTVKGLARFKGVLSDAHIHGLIESMPCDKLNRVAKIPTGRFYQISNGGHCFEKVEFKGSLSVGRYLEHSAKLRAANIFYKMKAIMVLEDSRKMFIQNGCLGCDHVYIVSDINNPDRVKIGVSKNVAQRIYQLDREFDTSFYIHTVLIGAGYATEKELHDYLSDDHIEREFFYKSDKVDNLISFGKSVMGYEFTEDHLSVATGQIPF